MSNKDLLIITVLTLITVLLWTFFEAYHIHITSTIPKTLQEQIEPINPTLKRDVVERLRMRFNEGSLPTPAATSSSSTALPEPTISSSSSAF